MIKVGVLNEKRCKEYFLEYFTVETERILSYYSQNLFYAISVYYELNTNLESFEEFIISMIDKQFEYIDSSQLFMD